MKTLIIIVGPTAVGKTDLAIWLANKLNTEIISADSRQIYKEISIGTAKPTEKELKQAKHHLIGTISIKDYYNAYMFEQDALKIIDQLFKKYDVLLMVGGSGLYVDAVIKGIDDIPTVIPYIRKELEKWFKQAGLEKLQYLTKRLDPEFYKKTDINNPMRLLKALEITIQTNKPYSSYLTGKPKKRPFNIVLIGLDRSREELHDRINKRVLKMIEQGLIDEAKKLFEFRHLTPLKTVGYREIFDYLEGKIDLNKAIELIQRNTRRYARRQLTWFRRYPDIVWFNPEDKEKILKFIKEKINSKSDER